MNSNDRRLPAALVGAGIAAFGIALMLAIGLVVDRLPFGFDKTIIVGLREWGGPPWLRGVATAITTLGNGPVLTAIVLVAMVLLLLGGHRLTALVLGAAALSGSWVVDLLKAYFGRPRPTLVEHWAVVSNMSFPSGHAASSALIYLTLAALASQLMRRRAARNAIVGAAILLVGAIGASRVYLGVHWPSDVLAGWSFGTLWAIGWWRATAAARASFHQR